MNVMLESCNVMWGWAKQNALPLQGRCSEAEGLLSEDVTEAWWYWALLRTGFQLHLGLERRSRHSSSLNLVHCAIHENQWCFRVCEEKAWGQAGTMDFFGLLCDRVSTTVLQLALCCFSSLRWRVRVGQSRWEKHTWNGQAAGWEESYADWRGRGRSVWWLCL